MKKIVVLGLLVALVGCGDDSSKGPVRREFQVKSAPKDESQAQMEKTIAEQKKLLEEQEKRLQMMEDLVAEVKEKQSEVDEALEIRDLAEKGRKDSRTK